MGTLKPNEVVKVVFFFDTNINFILGVDDIDAPDRFFNELSELQSDTCYFLKTRVDGLFLNYLNDPDYPDVNSVLVRLKEFVKTKAMTKLIAAEVNRKCNIQVEKKKTIYKKMVSKFASSNRLIFDSLHLTKDASLGTRVFGHTAEESEVFERQKTVKMPL